MQVGKWFRRLFGEREAITLDLNNGWVEKNPPYKPGLRDYQNEVLSKILDKKEKERIPYPPFQYTSSYPQSESRIKQLMTKKEPVTTHPKIDTLTHPEPGYQYLSVVYQDHPVIPTQDAVFSGGDSGGAGASDRYASTDSEPSRSSSCESSYDSGSSYDPGSSYDSGSSSCDSGSSDSSW